MHLQYIALLLCSAIVLVVGQEDEFKDLKDKYGLNVDEANIPTQEDLENLLKEKCLKEANEEAYHKVNSAKEDLQHCIEGIVDVETLFKEIEEAKPTGDLDLVFKKYCGKTPQIKNCMKNYTSTLEACLNEKERENTKVMMNVTESLTNFICYKEGDRIALFIAEGGPECIASKQEGIIECVNSTLTKYIPSETPSLNNLPEFIIKPEQCDDMNKMQQCIVKELETCEQPTPANIAESLFKFIKQVTPCGKGPQAQRQPAEPVVDSRSGASTLISSLTLVLLALNIV